MTSKELTELEWLSTKLRAAADALQRAAVLLRASRDMEAAEKRLLAIAAATVKPAAERQPAHEANPKRVGVSSPELRGRSAAVFDPPLPLLPRADRVTTGGGVPF